jgi:perosamine synthetase
MKVPQFQPWIGEDEYKAIKSCFDSNWITEGPKTKEFVKRMLLLTGAEYGVMAPTGTLGLYLALKGAGIGPGDEVIVPDFTFLASASAVEMTGAVPVFCDVTPYNFQIDVSSAQEKITQKTKAIMPVHIYGMSANMERVMELADRTGLLVVEDAAQAVGVKYKSSRTGWLSKHCGTFGATSMFSFFADKTVTMGEGAFVATNDAGIYDKLLYMRNQGRKNRGSFIHPEIGYNFRTTDILTSVGLVQLEKMDRIVNIKNIILSKYHEFLSGIEEIRFIKVEPGTDPYIPFRIAIIASDAQKLMAYMASKEIEPRSFFYPMHRQPCFQKYAKATDYRHDMDDRYFPNAIYGYENGVCLPSFVALKEEEIEYVCNTIKEFYHGK